MLPSVTGTSCGAFTLGVAWGLLLLAARPDESLTRKLLRRLLVLALSGFLVLWCHLRQPSVKDVTKVVNVSGSPVGPCLVTTRVLSISNSHAGTHADTPAHFMNAAPTLDAYDDAHYTGAATLIDLSEMLRQSGTRTISGALLRRATIDRGFDLTTTWRLLICTRNPNPSYDEELDLPDTPISSSLSNPPDEWDPDFAHFDATVVEFLEEFAPRLLLLGIDTPSVDHPSASPICQHTHGALFNAGIAIIENLSFERLYLNLRVSSRLTGALQTVFNPTQEFCDSRGCIVTFFPDP